MKIYNIGSANVDYVYQVPHFVRPGETLSATSMQVFPGGKGLNQSVALAKAGIKVIHGGRVGDGSVISRNQLLSAYDHAAIPLQQEGEEALISYNLCGFDG